MQAVGNALLRAKPNARVDVYDFGKLCTGFVSSLQKGKVSEIKNCRLFSDLLLVDDIHLLAGKEASLVEFFYQFNPLLDESQRADYPDFGPLSKRTSGIKIRVFVSRFSWGLSVGVEPPEY